MVENNQFTGEFPALANLINLSELTVGGNAGLCRGNNIDYAGRAEVEALPFCEFSCSNVTEIPQSECEVLVNIYDDLGGDNWTNNVGWKQTNNPCTSWYNLGCKNGHVTDIALESNNLSGVIPDLIALTELETLPIGNNPNITGAIPEIGSLTKLYHFSIGNTGISGSIPSSILGATSLRELGLSDNPNLTGELPDFSQLPNLRELNLGGSGFTGAILSLPSNLTLFNVTGTDLCRDLSTDYGSYSQVNDLPICDFSCADVTQIPVNQCEALVDFYHSTNGDSWARSENWLETGTPCDWYGITCESGLLKGINLDNNNLTGTVSDLSGLTDLTGLYLHINKLTGNLPDWSQLVNLQTIYLQTNQFTGGIPSFSGLNKLSTIILYQNNLTGTVPDVSHLVYLVNFQMQTNELSGVLPEIKNLKHLIHFNVENNHFTGEIPDITGLTKLTTFRVAANLLTGSLPVLDDFSQLVTFSVNTNQLTGTIPEFGNVPKLDAYIVSNNNLIGSLPDSLRNLPSLTLLNVALNKLTGDISIISDLESIEVINLEHNHFEGELPSFSKLKWLEDIVLNGNNLTGGIPEINHLVHAWRLFLGVNYFEGVIPPMDQLELVTALNLNSKTNGICYSPNINYGKHAADIQQRYPQCSEEQLTAITCDDITEIPQDECQALEAIYTNTNGNDWTNNDWFKSKYPCNWHGVSCENGRVTAIDLDNNNLVGELPDELEVLTEMGVLSASGNKLEGDIPNLNALANLEKLDLSNNKLTSNIPNLDNLINLKHADLSDNQLTGNLPSLDGLSKLENLFLDGNDLTGKLPDTSVAPNLTNISVDQDDDICQKSSYDYSAYPQLAAYPECASSILGINKKGSGSGSVNTDDGNIVCATHCIAQSFNYPENEQVTLSAVPDAGSVFKSWGGSCRGIEPTISIQMQRSKTCLALFDLEQDENSHLLEVRKKGSGRGSFSIKQAGNLIDVCGESCANKRQHRFPMGNTVDISARAATGSQFTGWTGACEAETLPNISITIDASKSCAAIIDLLPEPPPNMIRLEVGEHENSSGHGKIEMIGINCGNDCEDYIEAGRTVGLKADPDALSSFVSWMGESPQCQAKTTPYLQITPYEDMACYALFNSALDQMAAEEVIEFYEQGELNDDTVLTEEYPPIPINNEHLEYAYRLALSALIQVDEHLAVTGEWPTQFENLQRYLPEPVEFYVESVQIQSRTEINLLDRDVTVVGLFVRVDVVLEHKTGAEELLPILIYYGEEPIEESVVYLSGLNKDTSRRRGRRGRHYGCYPRRRRW
ncbi:hypothetical protein [Candidatus Albibeggiatoa sp. nov. BB20]|uniref:InlB B-repeat-containing protein n=1 Tax=Candidatus Albibeggiatoa sp. nov. BB20 TaxID=3162723 RepID=UPI003365AB78